MSGYDVWWLGDPYESEKDLKIRKLDEFPTLARAMAYARKEARKKTEGIIVVCDELGQRHAAFACGPLPPLEVAGMA